MRAKLLILPLFCLFLAPALASDAAEDTTTIASDEIKLTLRADSLKFMKEYGAALEYWEQVYNDISSSKRQRIRALNESADLYLELNNTQVARARLEQAMDQIGDDEELLDLKSQNRFFRGRYFSKLQLQDSSLFNFREAAFMAENAEAYTILFLSWVELGKSYHEQKGNDLAAIYYFNKALHLSEAELTNIPIIEAQTSYQLAKIANGLNEKEKATDYSMEALSIMDSLPESIHFDFIAEINYLLATLYTDMLESDEAIPHLKRAIALRHTYQAGNLSYNVEKYFPALSRAYEEVNKLDSAIIIEDSLRRMMLPELAGPGSANELRLARLTIKRRNLGRAAELSSSYYRHYRKNSPPGDFNYFQALLLRGDYFTAADRPDSAMAYFTRALATVKAGLTIGTLMEEVKKEAIPPNMMPRAVAVMERAAIALTRFSESNMMDGQLASAIQLFEGALEYARYNTLENVFGTIETGNKIEHFHSLTEYALEATFQQYQRTGERIYQTKALQLMENDKLLAIREESAKAMFLNQIGLSDSLQAEFDQLSEESLARIDNLKLAINDREKHERESLVIESFQKIVEWRQEAQRYIRNSKTRYDLFDDITFMDFHDHSNIHFIEYFYGQRHVYGLSLSDSLATFIERDIAGGLVTDIYDFLSHFWATPAEFSEDEMNRYIKSATKIYTDLVAPLMPELPSDKHVVVAPDGLIKLLPFETMLIGEPVNPKGFHELPYLIHSASVSYTTSAEMLLDLPPALPKYDPRLASFALNSNFGIQDSVSRYIVAELKNSRLFFEGVTFRGQQATKDAFIRNASKFEVLYLMIHGDAIDYPKLIFSSGSSARVERNLYTHEIYNLNLPGNVVVMTSTETGMGLIPHGEAVISMVRAFLSAGCGAVILGLWEAHDEHSKNIVGSFFRKLAIGENTLDALRQSKLEFLASADRLSAHPHNWAELISYGEPVDVSTEKDRGYLIWLVIVLLMLAIGTYISARREKYIDAIEEQEKQRRVTGP